jgi:Mor family transcriptional regulator
VQLASIIDKAAPGKGVEITMLIAGEFRGTTIYCHNIDALFRKARDRWVREKFDAGGRVPDLARTIKLSERRVWEILGSEPVNERQGRLF